MRDFNAFVNTIDGDAHGDVNAFWHARDHVKDAANVKAAVFAVHGFQDDNVRHGPRSACGGRR